MSGLPQPLLIDLTTPPPKRTAQSKPRSTSVQTDGVPPKQPPNKPTPRLASSYMCCICMDSFQTISEDDSRKLMATSCGHVMCSACIEGIIKMCGSCPICRQSLVGKDLRPLYINF